MLKGKVLLKPEKKDLLAEICQALLKADPKILEIIQFGSSVYAPDSALDIDLLVVTEKKKDYGRYLDAVADFPLNIDVIPAEKSKGVGPGLVLGLCGAHRVLFGSGEFIKEVKRTMPIPTYEEAREGLLAADRYLSDAHEAPTQSLRDTHYRTAFNALFDAARRAAMTYLVTEETRWGELRRALPRRFAPRFRRIVNVLHIAYFYYGDYPRERADEEFQKWRERVEEFIGDLEAESKGEKEQ